MNFLHTIRALLYKNLLTEAHNNYTARVKADRSLTLRDICESAAQRGGAVMSAGAMEQAVRDVLQEAVYRLGDGFSVNLEWFNASVHIKGVFDSPSEKFNPDKHKVKVEMHASSKLTDYIRSNVDVVIDGVADIQPQITRIVDVLSGSVDNLLTVGGNLFIYGSRIKVVGSGADVGVVFVDADGSIIAAIPQQSIVINEPTRLQILVPPIPAGTSVYVRITTQYAGRSGTLLKDARSVTYGRMLAAAAVQ